MLIRLLWVALLAGLGTACSDNGATEPTDAGDERLFDAQRDALDKAKQVEEQLQDAKIRLDRSLNEQAEER